MKCLLTMADQDSRLLREGRERSLIIEIIKTKVGYRHVNQLLLHGIHRQFNVSSETVQTISMQAFYFGEFKVSVVFQDFASEIKEDVYWIDIEEMNAHGARWVR